MSIKGLVSTLLLLIAVNGASANLIDTTHGIGAGSFELGTFVDGASGPGQPLPGANYMGVVPGDSTTITGWTVGGPGNGVDWLIEPRFNANTGIHSLDLQHTLASSISTVIPTAVGQVYELSFYTATVSGRDTEGSVSAGSLSNQGFTALTSSSFATQAYSPYSFLFTALTTSTTVEFVGTGQSFYGPVIDTVSVVEFGPPNPVPVPAAVWLFGTALIGLFGFGKQRKAN